MDRDLSFDPAPAIVWLHPNRQAGVCYGALGAVVLVIASLTVVSNVGDGHFLLALAATVGGLTVTTFLAILALALLVPSLSVRATGVAGRIALGRWVDVGWDEVLVDVPQQVPPGRLRLHFGESADLQRDAGARPDSVDVDVQGWAGFGEFVLLVASSPDAARRLTPAARREITRLLGQPEA